MLNFPVFAGLEGYQFYGGTCCLPKLFNIFDAGLENVKGVEMGGKIAAVMLKNLFQLKDMFYFVNKTETNLCLPNFPLLNNLLGFPGNHFPQEGYVG